ncbi:MAG: radical SAM protein [Proteobacteria bacterium]|nr:radical SAM protein [Pseudomonadota bacterium]
MSNSSLQLIGWLLRNGLRFQYLKRTGKPGKFEALSLEITHHCISKCIMCHIWKIPHETPSLSADHWIRLLSSDLFSDLKELDITGGEPFLREDLLDLFEGICELKQSNLKSLQSIAITTNGFLTRRVLGYAEEILQKLADKRMDLVMVCAMDGVGGIHDKIRNYKDAWLKVNETIQGLKELRNNFPNLILGLKTTILPINVGELEGIARYADSNGLFAIISPCIITRGRYLNHDLGTELAFTPEDMRKMIHFYETRRFGWHFHSDRMVQYFRTGRMRKPCSCGFNYCFVRSSGALYLCPLIDVELGNIKEVPIENLLFSQKASQMRRKIGRYPECKACTEPGLERYALCYEGFSYLSFLLKVGRKRFLQVHHHMGLEKFSN